jgi:hypothetical protein
MHEKLMSDDDWQAKYDMETLMRAREIEKDPKRMTRVRDVAKETAKAAKDAVAAIDTRGESALSQGYRKLG